MRLYAGIDGGQSATQALIGDESGRVLGAGEAPAADLVGLPRHSERQANALDAALREALARAELDSQTCFESVVVGLSGFEPGSQRPALPAGRCRRLNVVHDAEIAHAGAFAGKSGILVLAGTGSVALGVDDRGRRVRAGGWGYLFGDEGSAFHIARDAIARAMREEDSGRDTPLAARARVFFGAAALRDVQLGFAHGEISRTRVAEFAREIVALAERDANGANDEARALIDAAVESLVALCAALASRLGNFGGRFSYAGGLFESGLVRANFSRALRHAISGAQVSAPIQPPVAGALALAREIA